MKRKNNDNKEIITDMELKALAEAFVKSAVDKGYTASEIYQIAHKEWQKCIFEKRQSDMELIKENSEEIEFRKKAQKFVEENPSSIYINYKSIKYVEDGEIKNTNATIEFLCAMHKAFLSEENVTLRTLKKDVVARLKMITPYDFPAVAETDRAYGRISPFFKYKKIKYWCAELSELYDMYEFRANSISECILIMEWYLKKYC